MNALFDPLPALNRRQGLALGLLGLGGLIGGLSACSRQDEAPPAPGEIVAGLSCDLDGMLLDSAWPGHKGKPMRRGALPALADVALARRLQAAHGSELWSWPRLQALAAAQWPPALRGLGPRHAHAGR